MEFDHLRGFYHVAKLRSFTEAAGKLYLTQPAISLQVRNLERAIGEKLFHRQGRTICLTETGEILFGLVEELIAKLDDIQHAITEIQNVERGRLSLGASDTLSLYYLPALLKAFLGTYPNIELRITNQISEEVARRVADRELDLGLITLPAKRPKLEVLPLFCQRLVCICNPDHPLASRKMIDLRELSSERMIALERGSVTRERVDDYLSRSNSGTRPVLELSNFEVIKRYVAAGLGVAVVPEAAVLAERDNIRAVPLRQGVSIEVGLVYRQDRKLSHAARAFLELAKEFFRGQMASSAPHSRTNGN
jgi:DNA-binding transcriptional LysR family regulator